MSIKEKPLIDAVSRLGPLPGFLFSNPVVSGFFCILMCAVFGGVIMWFQSAGRGIVDTLQVFDAMRLGAIVVVAIAAMIMLGIAASAPFVKEEWQVRLRFAFGGFLGVFALAILDHYLLDKIRAYLATVGPIM